MKQMNWKYKFAIVSILLGLFAFSLWILTVLQYINPKAVGVASSFVEAVNRRDYVTAYSLTIQKGYVGNSIDEFRYALDNEIKSENFSGHNIESVYPFQSWGNYLKKRLHGIECETEQLNVDFRIELFRTSEKLPFEVRVIPDNKCQWKVNYFQTHAI